MKNKNGAASNLTRDDDFITQKGGSTDPDLLDRYAYRVSPHLRGMINGNVSNDPIAKQYIPQSDELVTHVEELRDPIGDEAHSPVKGIVHRYPDRVLFKPTGMCAVYCRYCFRREFVGPKGNVPAELLDTGERNDAIKYIAQNPQIWEVILTGGDPLVLSARHMGDIMGALSSIEHIKVIFFPFRFIFSKN